MKQNQKQKINTDSFDRETVLMGNCKTQLNQFSPLLFSSQKFIILLPRYIYEDKHFSNTKSPKSIHCPINRRHEKFIDSQKTQYGIQKGTQASNEYIAIVASYVNQIVSLQQQLKATQEKLPKKERVKVIKKGKR